jgi:hypothetical protein
MLSRFFFLVADTFFGAKAIGTKKYVTCLRVWVTKSCCIGLLPEASGIDL